MTLGKYKEYQCAIDSSETLYVDGTSDSAMGVGGIRFIINDSPKHDVVLSTKDSVNLANGILEHYGLARVDGWQSMASAPKDGATVDLVVVNKEFGTTRYADCYWGKPHHCCGEAGVHCGCCPERDDWCEPIIGYITGEDGDLDNTVTHWMRPLALPIDSEAG